MKPLKTIQYKSLCFAKENQKMLVWHIEIVRLAFSTRKFMINVWLTLNWQLKQAIHNVRWENWKSDKTVVWNSSTTAFRSLSVQGHQPKLSFQPNDQIPALANSVKIDVDDHRVHRLLQLKIWALVKQFSWNHLTLVNQRWKAYELQYLSQFKRKLDSV